MVVVGLVVSYYLKAVDQSLLETVLHQSFSRDEIHAMKMSGIADEDDFVDKGEFLVLVLVRLKEVDFSVIKKIFDKWEEVDKDKVGKVSYEQVIGEYLMGTAVVE